MMIEKDKILICNYAPKWEPAHIEFATEYFHGRRKRINPDYIYWKFRGEEGHELPSFLLAVYEEKVVGQIGLVPADALINEKLYPVQWICEIMVHNNFRGFGVAKLLYEEALRRKITLGSDPSPAAAKSLARSGFKNLLGPSKLFFPIKLDTITNKKAKQFSKLVKILPNPLFLLHFVKKLLLSSRFDIKSDLIKRNSIDFNWLASFQKSNSAQINRDSNFYDWRLSAFKNYQLEGEVYQNVGNYFLVLRKTKEVAFIGDFYYKNINVALAVLIDLIQVIKRLGIKELNLYSHDKQLIQALNKIGFLTYRTPVNIVYHSSNTEFNAAVEKTSRFNYTFLDSDENI